MAWRFTTNQFLTLLLAAASTGCVSFPGLFRKGDGKVVQTAQGTCTYLAPENQLHPLNACESERAYKIQVGTSQYVYAKAEFQKNLRERLWQFLRTTNYPSLSLKDAKLEVWLEAPVFEPSEAALKVVVLGPGGNFALPLSLDMNLWEVVPETIVRLGKDRYPSLSAKRSGVLAVMARGQIPAVRLQSFLVASGVLTAKTRAGRLAVREVRGEAPLLTLATEPFAESTVAKQLMMQKGAKAYLNDVRYVEAGEVEGYKSRVFAFGW